MLSLQTTAKLHQKEGGGGGAKVSTPAERLERRLRRFAADLQRAWSQHQGFKAFAATLDGLDFELAVEQIDEAVIDHVALILNRDDAFIMEVIPTSVPLLRELQLETVWTTSASDNNKDIIWQNLELVLSAASKEVKTMLKSQESNRAEQRAKATKNPFAGKSLNAIMSAMQKSSGKGGAGGPLEQITSMLSKFAGSANISPEMVAKLTQGEAGDALRGLMQCPEMFEALGSTVAGFKEAGASADGLKAIAADGSMLDSLRKAMRHREVRRHMKVVIAHFAPVLSKVIQNAQEAGADASNPMMQMVQKIINSAQGHPWAKMVDRFSTPEGAEAVLEIASAPNPKAIPKEKIASALGVSVEQLPELMSSIKQAATTAKEAGGEFAASSGIGGGAAGFSGILSGVMEALSTVGS
jgi:hypothetical protein